MIGEVYSQAQGSGSILGQDTLVAFLAGTPGASSPGEPAGGLELSADALTALQAVRVHHVVLQILAQVPRQPVPWTRVYRSTENIVLVTPTVAQCTACAFITI